MEYWCQENYAVMITDGDSQPMTTWSRRSYPGIQPDQSKNDRLPPAVITDFFKFDYNRARTYPWTDSRWGDRHE